MNTRGFWGAEGVLLDDAIDSEGAPVWIELTKMGSFAGHPAGPFELNAKIFGELIANFHSTANREIPVDWEHASEQDPTSGTIPTSGAPAAGWIKDLRVAGDRLLALVRWLPTARAQIRSGAYKYISAAIRFATVDRVTGRPAGAKLSSAGLTNTPFIDGLQPLAAKDTAPARSLSMHGRTRELVALGMTPVEASAQAARELTQTQAPPREPPPTDHHDLTAFIVKSTHMPYSEAAILAQAHPSDWWAHR
jgi:phage I-like protein